MLLAIFLGLGLLSPPTAVATGTTTGTLVVVVDGTREVHGNRVRVELYRENHDGRWVRTHPVTSPPWGGSGSRWTVGLDGKLDLELTVVPGRYKVAIEQDEEPYPGRRDVDITYRFTDGGTSLDDAPVIEVLAGGTSSAVFRVVPDGSISGRVVAPKGVNPRRLRVELCRYFPYNPWHSDSPKEDIECVDRMSTAPAADGSWRLAGVAGDWYEMLRVIDPSHALPTLHHPNAFHHRAAEQFVLGVGEQRKGVNFRMKKRGVFKGRINATPKLLKRGVRIRLRPVEGSLDTRQQIVRVGRKGRFRFRAVSETTYRICLLGGRNHVRCGGARHSEFTRKKVVLKHGKVRSMRARFRGPEIYYRPGTARGGEPGFLFAQNGVWSVDRPKIRYRWFVKQRGKVVRVKGATGQRWHAPRRFWGKKARVRFIVSSPLLGSRKVDTKWVRIPR